MSIDDISKACQLGDLVLLEKSIKQNPKSLNDLDAKLGWAPLYRSIVYVLPEAAEKLLIMGADPNVRNRLGQSPLHQASENNHVDLAKLLIRYKSNPNLPQNDGDTALHLACSKGFLEMSQILLRAGANPNSCNYVQGRTPLHYACEIGQIDIIKTLLEYKANPQIRDKNSLTPGDLTTDCKIVGLLENSNAIKIQEEESNSKDSIHEPESEKAIMSSNRFINQPHFSFGEANKSPLFNWLQSLRLENTYEYLQSNGFDDLDQLVECMKGNTPLTEELLKKIGIEKVGYRLRLLARLEEYGAVTSRYSACNDSKLWCGTGSLKNNYCQVSLIVWLKSLNLEYLYINFVENGFDEYEQLTNVMASSFPVTDEILFKELKIAKIGHRHRIMSRLNNDKNPGFFRNAVRIDRGEKTPACESCGIM